VFARACTARTARGRIVELATNGPVTIGEISVMPGDYVIADGSAVVFVRPENIERVLEAAELIAAREASMAAALSDGKPIGDVMDARYEHMLKE
jgi:regulator of RNase E activity RraA